jgi:hypothetical protein
MAWASSAHSNVSLEGFGRLASISLVQENPVRSDEAVKIEFASVFVDRLESLRRVYGHSIKMIGTCGSNPLAFNCYAYALGVWDNAAYLRLANANKRETAIVDSSFIREMLECGDMEEIDANSIRPGDLLLYFDGSAVKHGGKFVRHSSIGMIVRSKWGPGELFEHGEWEVPATYGDRLRFFKRPDPKVCLRRLKKNG